MDSWLIQAAKARSYSGLTAVYLVTLLFAWYVSSPSHQLFNNYKPAIAASYAPAVSPTLAPVKITSGRPIRIRLPSLGIDLPIDDGFFNDKTGEWTLSGYHAQFAVLSKLANDHDGNTFVYGHYNKYVFYNLKNVKPGAEVAIYTDNQYVFYYTFESAQNVKPSDTSELTYQGPPILTVQTCSGNWFEWRRMYTFKFEKVVG